MTILTGWNHTMPENEYVNKAQRLKIPPIEFPKNIFTFYLSHPFASRHEVRKWELAFEERYPSIALLNPFYDVGGEGRDDVRARDEGKDFERDAGYNWRLVQRDLVALTITRGIVGIVDKNSGESFGTKMEFVYARILASNPKLLICEHPHSDHPWFQTHFDKTYRSYEEFEGDVERQIACVRMERGF